MRGSLSWTFPRAPVSPRAGPAVGAEVRKDPRVPELGQRADRRSPQREHEDATEPHLRRLRVANVVGEARLSVGPDRDHPGSPTPGASARGYGGNPRSPPAPGIRAAAAPSAAGHHRSAARPPHRRRRPWKASAKCSSRARWVGDVGRVPRPARSGAFLARCRALLTEASVVSSISATSALRKLVPDVG
jgi:hypothetical protein